MSGNYSQTTQRLAIAVILGMCFTLLRDLEYHEASFTFEDSLYDSTLFIATGFSWYTFLAVCLNRHMNCDFGFEAAAWY